MSRGLRGRVGRVELEMAFTARTSRNVIERKTAWLVQLADASTGRTATGECAPFPGLSPEWNGDAQAYEELLSHHLDRLLATGRVSPDAPSSVKMGLESALEGLADSPGRVPFRLPINGLVWIDTPEAMLEQARRKIEAGFGCIKIKIGSTPDFGQDIELLDRLRCLPGGRGVTLRVDANGAFGECAADAMPKLRELALLRVHSIEQPLMAGCTDETAELCRRSPVAIALDEELAGAAGREEAMLRQVRPQYIVIKPTLHGGLSGARRWLALAHDLGCGAWFTSALETNVGLHAIGRLAAASGLPRGMAQGLGTGRIFKHNLPGPVELQGEHIVERPDLEWDFSAASWSPWLTTAN